MPEPHLNYERAPARHRLSTRDVLAIAGVVVPVAAVSAFFLGAALL